LPYVAFELNRIEQMVPEVGNWKEGGWRKKGEPVKGAGR